MRVIAGDVGGTKTLLALCEVDAGGVRALAAERFESRSHPSFGSLVSAFGRAVDTRGAESLCVAAAGPVEGGRCRATNLPWVLDEGELAAAFGVARARLVNDFYAAACGVEALSPHDLVTLQEGSPRDDSPRVVIGAGTGLGQALLVPVDGRWRCVPGEGGHADFAPRNARERGLAAGLEARHGRVSWERVASGSGLADIYAYLRDVEGIPEARAVADEIAGGDLGAAVGAHALAADDRLCEETLALFLAAYGAEAGNAALRVLARGGVFLAGGIAAKVLPLMLRGPFMKTFCDKGRMSALARAMPVHVVTDPMLGLRGAAMLAARET